MDIEKHIQKELWEKVCTAYESSNFSYAILDAIHYLTDYIRSKTGLDGDGVPLINDALGGNSPKLRINKFQTETEKSEQEGLKLLLMGLYRFIRNPRSHEIIKDQQKQADTIIAFIDYLQQEISRSQTPFTIEGFIAKVFDPDFVQSITYAQLLVDEIPENKRLDVYIEIYRKKEDVPVNTILLMLRELISRLKEPEQEEIYKIISEELAITQEFRSIIRILKIFTEDNWKRINQISKMRIENKIRNSLKQGRVDPDNWEIINKEGALATWANQILFSFENSSDIHWIFREKLNEINETSYILRFFGREIPLIFSKDNDIKTLASALNNHAENCPIFSERIEGFVGNTPWDWQNKFLQVLRPLNEDLYKRLYENQIPF